MATAETTQTTTYINNIH